MVLALTVHSRGSAWWLGVALDEPGLDGGLELGDALCCTETWAGAVTAVIGSTLLRPSAVNSPAQ
jgi:hypothetical protein